MPCNYKNYAANWKWLSKQIISDAGNKCELCYAPNGKFVVRNPDCEYPWELAKSVVSKTSCSNLTKIVLTVHHIDADKKNNNKQNLIALCQRCHLRLDLHRHITNRKKTKDQQSSQENLL